jgi:cytochrome c-type protein NapB
MADSRQPKSLQSGMIAGGVIVMIAVSGYFVGLRQTNSAISMTRPVEVVREDPRREIADTAAVVPRAVRYIDQDWPAHGVNALLRTSLADFTQLQPPADAKRVIPPEEKDAALRDRAARRAYDGAPPVVPHPVTQDSSAACLACHGQGMQVKDRFASKISHPVFGGSCTQCHVSSTRAFTAAGAALFTAPLTENSFQGKEAPATGTRAWKGAPPAVPHRTLMRSDCLSCHGPNGTFALRTSHPERQSCTQCHVSAAAIDQREFIDAPPPDAPPPPAPAPLTTPPSTASPPVSNP